MRVNGVWSVGVYGFVKNFGDGGLVFRVVGYGSGLIVLF